MTQDISVRPHKHHILIAGTGRAGTSFLVRYFDRLGLETHFKRHGEGAHWDEAANAGAEDMPLSAIWPDLPYVVKSPWSAEFIDQVLADDSITLDAVIIPLRDLQEAASSRTINELRSFAANNVWTTKLDQPWEHWGHTAGGIVYSLHPLDQARILALGFHKLIERLVRADVKIIMLSFPRLVQDAAYLHNQLASVLPAQVTRGAAMAAHHDLADAAKIRVGRELADSEITVLDRAALNRELEQLRADLSAAALREASLAEHVRLIETSRMWRALAPLRAWLHKRRRKL
ncbi:MAG: hypothetical protein B7Z78_06260 [Rhodospirillales bacterium 20-60-12]|nr:MAG: hypothetical protein B7Z78_06260 [Rhodospirillales bacterium 20-60-12]HQT67698.1 hypothetical protein [Acetobacteraceae bacterium]HQU02388.1 hypothetical protein [Acetobacteraceae bacterium]